jgi:hypothetical protein
LRDPVQILRLLSAQAVPQGDPVRALPFNFSPFSHA